MDKKERLAIIQTALDEKERKELLKTINDLDTVQLKELFETEKAELEEAELNGGTN